MKNTKPHTSRNPRKENIMKKVMKWIGVVIGSLVTLAIIAWIGLIIYSPDVHSAFMHTLPGVPQRKLPTGVMTTVVIENVTVISMDSEHALEGYTVVIENGRIADMGANGEVEIPVDAHIVEGSPAQASALQKGDLVTRIIGTHVFERGCRDGERPVGPVEYTVLRDGTQLNIRTNIAVLSP